MGNPTFIENRLRALSLVYRAKAVALNDKPREAAWCHAFVLEIDALLESADAQ